MKKFLLTLLIPFAVLLTGYQSSAAIPTDEASIKKGKDLFKTNCKACHKIDKDAIGPALKGVTERQSEAWLMAWIANPQKIIESGDAHAVEMKEKYSSLMTSFPTLSNKDKLAILGYVEAWMPPPPPEGTPTTGTGSTGGANNASLDIILIIILGALLLILIILLLIAALLNKHLNNQKDLDEDDKELVNQSFSIVKVLTNSNFITIVAVVAMLVGFLLVLKLFLYRIGVQHGYAPVQPIPFSHKIHAGDNKIDCNYCHTGVRKAKHANIPSVNICMNCHNSIKVESPEIQKIHKHAGYDVETKTYDESKASPIEWIRVHNLPDLAYFNHSQHVKVGGVECQECHIGIEEMDGYVEKTSELTMAWCIDCHRSKSIDKTNPYYVRLIEFNKVHRGLEDLKVKDIGGLECSKCHY
jgi:mono/diheme cytochrome c family protein